MTKISAITILAMAGFAGRALADADCAPDVDTDGEESRCWDPAADEQAECCDGLQCVQQNAFYAQCRGVEEPIPAAWDGNIIAFGDSAVGADGEAAMAPGAMVEEEEEEAPMPADDEEEEAPAPADEEEMETVMMAPVIDQEGLYMSVVGMDYIPSETMPTLVDLEDIEMGNRVVTDEEECMEMCDVEPGCNAASFYLDPSAFVGFEDSNCWLKIIGEPCEVPSDAAEDTNAILLLKVDTCPNAMELAGTVGDALGPDAVGPDALGPDAVALAPSALDADAPAPEDVTTTRGDVDIGTDNAATEAPTTVVDPDSAVTVRGAAAALAVAAAVAAALF